MHAKSTLRLVSVFLVLSLAQVPALYGQPRQFVFEHLTVEGGFPDHNVRTILQDHLGFLWFGMANGLVRYDGYSLDVFSPDPTDSTSIGSGNIASLYEDEAGALWIGAGPGGLYRFDRKTEGFTRYVLDGGGESKTELQSIRSITEDRDNRLWLIPGGRGGLVRLDPRTGGVTRYRHDPGDSTSLPHDNVETLLQDRSGRLWVGTRDGLGMLNRETGTFTCFGHDSDNPNSLSHSNINALLEDRQGHLWIGTWGGGLNRFDPETETFSRFLHDPLDPISLSDGTVHFIHEDQSGLLWIGTGRGLNRFDAATGTFTHFLPDPDAPQQSHNNSILTHFEDQEGLFWLTTPVSIEREGKFVGLPHKSSRLYSFDPSIGTFVFHKPDPTDPDSFDPASGIQSIYQDRAGTLWIGTQYGRYGSGINKLDRSATKFSHYTFGSEHVRSIRKDREGRLWIGTGALTEIPQFGALHQLDLNTGEVISYRHDPKDPTSLSWDFVQKIFGDSRGRLWVASTRGLESFDPETATFSGPHVPYSEPADPRDNGVIDIVEGRKGTLWLSTHTGGLLRFDMATKRFTTYRHDPDDPNSIPTNRLWSLRFDSEGILWIGTQGGGLIRFDPVTERFTRYYDRASGLAAIAYILEGQNGELWLASFGGGLLRFDRETGDVTTFTTDDGLPHNRLMSILGDSDGKLWIATVAGLSRFDPDTGKFRNYHAVDGLRGFYFEYQSAFRDEDGNLYFGGKHGLNIVDLDQVQDNPHPPQVVVTDLRALDRDEQELQNVRLSGADEVPVRISHRQNDVTFEFVALHFSRPEKNLYQYMLEGYDRTWSETGTQRTATYTNLEPNSYTFRVKAANADGIWNEEGASVRFVIVPPWWQHAWFYVLCILGLLALAYAVYRVRVHQLRVQARALQEQVAERTRELVAEKQKTEAQAGRLRELDEAKSRFFANISHEFRTPLTLIMGPVQDALAGLDAPVLSRAQLRLIHQNARRLLRLVKQLFDLSKLEASQMKLNRQAGDLAAFVRSLVRSFAPLAERRGITLQYRVETEVRPFAFDREALEKVFSNLLSNALKFTPQGGKVWVTVHARDQAGEDSVEVVVKDTGPGIPGAELERIFDRFEQVDGSATRAHQGMGLGLALARELVELHGGALRVESELGFGSAFIVWLPLRAHAETPILMEAPVSETPSTGDGAAELEAAALLLDIDGMRAEAEPTSASDKPIVLVVEDNQDVRQLLRDYLEADYRVLEAADGEAGLEAARQHKPDLVLSDVMMPRMDGYDLCRALKADEELRAIPVMLLTAKASEEDRLYGLEGGADDYLSKPFSRRELEVRVANLILSRRELRQQFSREIHVKPTDVVIQPEDEAFLEQVLDVMETHLGDSTFTTDGLADALGLSRRQAERRVKGVTGETPLKLMRRMRLERAAQLLKARPGSISEVAYTVGFKSSSHFARVFREQYGVAPSEHIENPT